MEYELFYKARDTIASLIKKDAFGPIEDEETLDEPPLDTYVCGILWPKKSKGRSEIASQILLSGIPNDRIPDRDTGIELEEEQSDVIREANKFSPSVMAVSFVLSASASELKVIFTAGCYENIDIPVENKSYVLHEYRRKKLDTEEMVITLPSYVKTIELFEGRAALQIVRRKNILNERVLWTISIENKLMASRDETEQNTSALFQCELTVRGDFYPVDSLSQKSHDLDKLKQSFLYRNVHSYAVGHGCSVTWNTNSNSINEIKSTFLPDSVVSQMIAVTDDDLSCFKMYAWRDERREKSLDELESYVQKYENWGEGLHKRTQFLENQYQEVADGILFKINQCVSRLRAGINMLRTDEQAWKAFRMMNKAMMRQSARKRHQPEEEVSWYPFQLCYVLMCIPDIQNPEAEWRRTVDLLWFPTGGGKTEAYLGVAAFTIFYRRLIKGNAGSGVTVLMRYTLRMLTAQQFERAAALICECELIRRQEKLDGGEISIGLWVGGDVTPNHVTSTIPEAETAETILENLKCNRTDEVRSSPVQLSSCPYCGEPLLPNKAYNIKDRQFRVHCPNENCPFHDDLPVITVDDDVYSRRPTLLIGTIDKFARLTWEDKSGAIFAEDGRGLPPELLIQDELHLISGPLGSLSGLYEIAIEKLCEHNGIKPKILASTATLCNADQQILALYGRPAFQFPPSGFDADDSFFARKATPQERPERQYLGFCETGGSLPDALVRVFGVAKFALQYLAKTGIDPKVIDQFWTNVGYFNSLKDLGSADTLIIDRVCAYAESLRMHKFKALAEAVGIEEIPNTYEYGELTSRKSTREITEIRNQLDQYHYPDKRTLDYVLSSNMLSVGIDINRLGLMTVYGQPKATAEYIQATSRVGRSNPGLVVVLLHMHRTRDKSHFEQFRSYHLALNKMVEPTSVTPYSCRSMDKALHSVFVALIRHLCPAMRANVDASRFRQNDPYVKRIRDDLLKKIEIRSEETRDYAEDILDDFIARWDEIARNRGAHFQYQLQNKSENDTDALLIPAERSDNAIFPPSLNSMRNVDTQSGVYIKR